MDGPKLTAIHQDIAVYRQFGGIVLEAEEGEHIVEAMGDKKVRTLFVNSCLS